MRDPKASNVFRQKEARAAKCAAVVRFSEGRAICKRSFVWINEPGSLCQQTADAMTPQV
ncbi:hypothetical protein [Mycolicibacterium obuense]|uniref:hypothetical protein n=1 Tax=Mycolicibacterium obuense TaxID=1807 RepID=UPI000A62A2EB|nr:hypothetical protein [Mycolicibacterium obuense]